MAQRHRSAGNRRNRHRPPPTPENSLTPHAMLAHLLRKPSSSGAVRSINPEMTWADTMDAPKGPGKCLGRIIADRQGNLRDRHGRAQQQIPRSLHAQQHQILVRWSAKRVLETAGKMIRRHMTYARNIIQRDVAIK